MNALLFERQLPFLVKMRIKRSGESYLLPLLNYIFFTNSHLKYVLFKGYALILLEELFPKLLLFFAQGNIQQNMTNGQATVRKLTDVIYFVSLFDELKVKTLFFTFTLEMLNPNIQNDFSYYKRSLVKMRVVNNYSYKLNDKGTSLF